jgi:Uma2 family endonuclease
MSFAPYTRPPERRERKVSYPEGDGKPMAETDVHRDLMFYFIEALKRWFSGQDVYVSGNILLYYVEGDPRKRVSPDTLVAKDLKPGRRRIYKVWEEGKVPDLVIEVTSKGTRIEDRRDKSALYARLGVKEMWLVDPLNEYLGAPFLGYELVDGEWRELSSAGGRAHSRVLELDIVAAPGGVWLAAPNGELLPGPEQLDAMLKRAQTEDAILRRDLAARDRRIAELESELQKLRNQG